MLLRRKLTSLGLSEARSLVLIDETSLKNTLEPKRDTFQLRNPLAEDQQILRPSLIPGLLRAAERNFNRGGRTVALFELGQVFLDAEEEEVPRLGVVLSGESATPSWNQARREYDLFDAKSIVEMVHGSALQIRRLDPTDLVALLCEAVNKDGRSAAYLGLLRPRHARALGAKSTVVIAEIALPQVAARPAFKFKPLERFPAIARDVALVAPRSLRWEAVVSTLNDVKEPLLVDVQVFDLFLDPTGEKIPADKKSLACSLTYRASDRTLTQEEVNEVHQRLKTRLVDELGVTLREG